MRKLLRRLRYFITQRHQQVELAEEMEFHREMKERELRAAGSAVDDAKAGALRAFGSVALAHDEARDAWIWPWLQDVWTDVRFAVRLLAKDPRFTSTAVLTLALAIAVNNTIFTIINTAVLRDVPFDEPNRLVSIGTRDARGRELQMSYLDFNDWRATTRTFVGLAAYRGGAMNISDDAQAPERDRGGAYVSAETFRLLRIKPIFGRDFRADDERPGAPSVVILGEGLWQRRYGGDRSLLGRVIRINEVPSTVIGVMPADFRFPLSGEVWRPLSLAPGMGSAKRDMRSLSVFGRLAETHTIDQARADLDALAAQTGADHPDTNKDIRSRISPMSERMEPTAILMTLMGSVIFVLLIACANVANLLLARSASRTREIAIRASLGATRWRIVRQLLIECGIVAALAGMVGLGLSLYGVKFLGAAFAGKERGAPASSAVTAYWVDLSMNEPVFLFLGLICLFATLLSGLGPALHVSRTNVNVSLRESGRGAGTAVRARRWADGFIVAQIALTLVLLTGGGLMLRSFVSLYRADRVIDTSGVVTARVSLPMHKYETPEARRRFFESLTDRLAAVPMLKTSAIASVIPFAEGNVSRQLLLDAASAGEGAELPNVSYVSVSERYFETLGVRMIRGRPLEAEDLASGREGAIVNQRFATMFLTDGDVLGRRIRLMDRSAPKEPAALFTIIGVVGTIPRSVGSDEPDPPTVYVPLLGAAPPVASLIVRSRSDVHAVVSGLRDEVRALDANLPLYYVQTLEEAFADAQWGLRIIGGWFGALAVIALVLATVGLYGVTGHAVTQRTQEIGVRVALGAERHQVLWLFLRRTIVQLTLGVVIGIVGALAAGQLLQTWMLRIDARDPLTLVLVTILLIAVGIVATLLPARRAARIEPLVALRYE